MEACAEPLARTPSPPSLNAVPRAALVSEAQLKHGRRNSKILLTRDDEICGSTLKEVK
jgi:hypothetical protein